VTIRASIVQPAMPAYRIPVFRTLAARDGIDLQLHYASQKHLGNAEAEGYKSTQIRARTLRIKGQSIVFVPTVWQLATRKNCDVLAMPWNTRWVLNSPALARARRRGVGTVVWGHGFSKRESPKRLALRDAVANKADSVVFYNNTAADAFRARNPGHAGVFVAINSLDQTEIQRARTDWLSRQSDLKAFKAEHGLDAGPVAIFVSRLLEENRAEMLLEATSMIENLTAVIIGKGPDADRLKSITTKLGIEDRVRFPGAIYGEDSIAPWYVSSHVFVYPVNIGLSAMHALGYGVPIVTSDNIAGHNPEIEAVEDGSNAVLYKDGDIESMANAIRSLTGDTEKQRAYSEAARQTVVERFNVPKMVDGLEAAVRHAHERARSRA